MTGWNTLYFIVGFLSAFAVFGFAALLAGSLERADQSEAKKQMKHPYFRGYYDGSA